MSNGQLKNVFVFLNYALGILIALISLSLFAKKGYVAPIYITVAIVIVGPIENLLMKMVSPKDRWIVDQITSILFLIFLLLAVLEFAK
ncbi:MAG TPA: hypothetical protein GX723_01850 [Thermoanaerobacterales bacterium]|jgi:hypothetical protein|nr:hypothetical protein [Thermoanaerobacterales bacterium]